jgi:hypothetical protein
MSNARELAKAAGSIGAGGFVGMKNRIINGDMRVDQRNLGSVTIANSWTYTLDRWAFFSHATGKYSVVKSSDAPPGFASSMLITSLSAYTPSASEYCGFKQAIEGYNVADLDFGLSTAKTVTLSFWIKSSSTGNYGGSLYNVGATRSYPFSYTINTANTWEKKIITIAGDVSGTWNKDNTDGIIIDWLIGAGSTYLTSSTGWTTGWNHPASSNNLLATSGATLRIAGVQFESGPQATPFEYRHYGAELGLCQRYYHQTWDGAATPSGFNGLWCSSGYQGAALTTGMINAPYTFPFKMRVAPSVSTWDHLGAAGKISAFNPNSSNINGETGSATQINTNGFSLSRASGGNASQIGAFFAINAEL